MSLALAEFIGFAGLILGLVGAWLQWGMPHRLADLEDAHKDGVLTEDQVAARRRLWMTLVPVLVVLGVCLLGTALYSRLG